MGLENAGRDILAGLAVGAAVTAFNAANAYIGVGDGDDGFDAADTDLQGTNKARIGMDSTYPQRTDNVLTFRGTFGLGAANFSWKEWAVFNAAAAGTMLSRKVESLFTKTAVISAQITVELTVTAA
jgi:hypothetical protein